MRATLYRPNSLYPKRRTNGPLSPSIARGIFGTLLGNHHPLLETQRQPDQSGMAEQFGIAKRSPDQLQPDREAALRHATGQRDRRATG